jgi:isoquinoline 1-oxidoreductase subunit alpha
MTIQLHINGGSHTVDVPAAMPLLWVLRNELRLLGTKFGCGAGLCGACTVHVDGTARRSCQLPVGQLRGAHIATIEQLSQTQIGARLQQAWLSIDVMQCGYCQAGQLMSAAALLARTPRPTEAQIDAAMGGNICRCACYHRIRSAIQTASSGIGEAAHVG